LIGNADKCNLDVTFQDWHKKNAVHYLVNPCSFGSYENVEMLNVLHQAGYKLDIADDQNMVPLDYAT